MNTLEIISLIKKRNDLSKKLKELRLEFAKLRTKESFNEYQKIRRSYHELDLYGAIYTFDVMNELFNICNEEKSILDTDSEGNSLFGYISDDGIPVLTLSEQKIKIIKKPADIQIDNRSDDDFIYDFIQENEANGLECTKKFIESMLTSKISRARIGDSLIRLEIAYEKIILTDSNDLTVTDKVYKIQK